jgi:hypothetical protein
MQKIDFAKGNGLIPVIVQDFQSGKVLMLAYMNEEAWKRTQKTGKAHYYSRSRQGLWLKGEAARRRGVPPRLPELLFPQKGKARLAGDRQEKFRPAGGL